MVMNWETGLYFRHRRTGQMKCRTNLDKGRTKIKLNNRLERHTGRCQTIVELLWV